MTYEVSIEDIGNVGVRVIGIIAIIAAIVGILIINDAVHINAETAIAFTFVPAIVLYTGIVNLIGRASCPTYRGIALVSIVALSGALTFGTAIAYGNNYIVFADARYHFYFVGVILFQWFETLGTVIMTYME